VGEGDPTVGVVAGVRVGGMVGVAVTGEEVAVGGRGVGEGRRVGDGVAVYTTIHDVGVGAGVGAG
jgi:hypothetical protein